MTRTKVLDRIEKALVCVALGGLGAIAIGWVADRIGILPPAARSFVRPLLVASGLTVAVAEASHLARVLFRRTRMLWTCAAAVVTLTVLTGFEAGAVAGLWPQESPLVFTLLRATLPLLSAGLLADAVVLWRRGIPWLGPVGAVAGGVGLLAFTAGTLGPASWVFFSSLPLLAVAGFAFFRVRAQLRAELPESTETAVRVPAPLFKWPGHRR